MSNNAQSIVIRTNHPNAIHRGLLQISAETGATLFMNFYGRFLWVGRHRITVRVDHDEIAVVSNAVNRIYALVSRLSQ